MTRRVFVVCPMSVRERGERGPCVLVGRSISKIECSTNAHEEEAFHSGGGMMVLSGGFCASDEHFDLHT